VPSFPTPNSARMRAVSLSAFRSPAMPSSMILRDGFGFVISRTGGKLEPGARSIKCLGHGFNVLGLESESMGSGFWHRGAAGVCVEGQKPRPRGEVFGTGANTRPFLHRHESQN
jgi:hypothetical protein